MRTTTVLVGCLLAFTTLAGAQDRTPDRMTLSEALSLAAARNPNFAAARNSVEAAEAARVEASRRPNPALTVESSGYPLFQSDRPSFLNNQELTVRLDQEIETGGRRQLRTDAASARIETARQLARNRLRELELSVKRAYMQAVLAEADRAVAQASLDEIDRVLGVSRARLQQGEIAGTDLRRLQVERLRFVDDVFAAELALRNARAALLGLVGADDLSQPIELSEPLASPVNVSQSTTAMNGPSVQALTSRALAARPDIAAARQELRRADTETRLQRALRAPVPTVGAGYKRDFGGNTVLFGVTLPVPLFNGLNTGAVERAAAEQRRAANEAAAAESAVRVDVQQAANALELNQQRVAYIEREYLAPARESRDIVAASFRLGAADLIDFLDAQRAFRDTTRTYNRAVFESRISAFELEAAVGEPLRQE